MDQNYDFDTYQITQFCLIYLRLTLLGPEKSLAFWQLQSFKNFLFQFKFTMSDALLSFYS